MNKLSILLLIFIKIWAYSPIFAQGLPELSDLKGFWCSELESTMEIHSLDLASGEIRGTYTTEMGGKMRSFPLLGWINTQAPSKGKHTVHVLSFSVRWGDLGSITSWTGTFELDDSGEPIIKTIWNLVRPSTNYSYEHIISQSSRFIYGACESDNQK